MKSRCIPLEVDVGHGDLLLLPLVGDLPRGVCDEGEDEEGGIDDQLHDQPVCPDSLQSGPQHRFCKRGKLEKMLALRSRHLLAGNKRQTLTKRHLLAGRRESRITSASYDSSTGR